MNWMDQDVYLQEIYISQNFRHKWSFSSSLSHGRGWCETPHSTNSPMPRRYGRFTIVKYNTFISQQSTGKATWNWMGTPEGIFQKTESRSSVYLQFQPSGCAPVCSKHYSEPRAMGACYLIICLLFIVFSVYPIKHLFVSATFCQHFLSQCWVGLFVSAGSLIHLFATFLSQKNVIHWMNIWWMNT